MSESQVAMASSGAVELSAGGASETTVVMASGAAAMTPGAFGSMSPALAETAISNHTLEAAASHDRIGRRGTILIEITFAGWRFSVLPAE